jgi:hypothetical protein
MGAATGIVFDLDPRAGPGLVVHLRPLGGAALAPDGCVLELVADRRANPRELHAIVSWQRAVPLKIERLARAVIAAGGVLRRDVDADGLRHRALVAGHVVARIASAADLEAFDRPPGTAAPRDRAPAQPDVDAAFAALTSAA